MNPIPVYTIERLEYGWLLKSPGAGMPMDAFIEAAKSFPADAVICPGIAHHYQMNGHPEVRLAVVASGTADKWRISIDNTLRSLSEEERWWKGTDVGRSSASIFGALSNNAWTPEAKEFSGGDTPRDADDFGRCSRLVKKFNWRDRLSEVAVCYPGSNWKSIVEMWDAIECGIDDITKSQLLQQCNSSR